MFLVVKKISTGGPSGAYFLWIFYSISIVLIITSVSPLEIILRYLQAVKNLILKLRATLAESMEKVALTFWCCF